MIVFHCVLFMVLCVLTPVLRGAYPWSFIWITCKSYGNSSPFPMLTIWSRITSGSLGLGTCIFQNLHRWFQELKKKLLVFHFHLYLSPECEICFLNLSTQHLQTLYIQDYLPTSSPFCSLPCVSISVNDQSSPNLTSENLVITFEFFLSFILPVQSFVVSVLSLVFSKVSHCFAYSTQVLPQAKPSSSLFWNTTTMP